MEQQLAGDREVSSEVFLVDFSWVLYKSFYAFDSLATVIDNKIVKTGTMFGFVNFMSTFMTNYPGGQLCFCLDSPVNYKVNKYSFYKANRSKRAGVHELHREILRLLKLFPNVGIVSAEGYEADDLIYTEALEHLVDKKVVVFSGDDDLLQLLAYPNIKIIRTMSLRETVPLDVDYVIKKFGVPPENLLLYRAIIGDTSDNIKPVLPRFPRALAVEIAKVRTLDAVKSLNPDSLKYKALIADENFAKLVINYELMSLCNVPTDQIYSYMPGNNPGSFNEFITKYALSSLRKLIEAHGLH